MFETEVLKWAAGSLAPLPPISKVDLDLLLAAAWEHRICGRFLRRLREEPQPWATPPLLAGLARRHAVTIRRVHLQSEAMRGIASRYGSAREPVIAVKGYTCYALTGDPLTARPSGDVDLLSGDYERLQATLRDLGYHLLEGHAPHELAHWECGDVRLDVHAYVPLAGFPPNGAADAVDPRLHPGAWTQAVVLPRAGIPYQALLHAAIAARGMADGLVVVEPALAALIACETTFRNSSPRWYPPRLAACRLGELADICDLVRHPQFCRSRFADLVAAFRSHYPVWYVGRLMQACLGHNPLPDLGTVPRGWVHGAQAPSSGHTPLPDLEPAAVAGKEANLPRSMMECLWALMNWGLDGLLLRGPATTFDGVVEWLGANTVVAGPAARRPLYCALDDGAGSQCVGRVIAQGEDGRRLPLRFAVAWGQAALAFYTTLPGPPDGCAGKVRLAFGDADLQWDYDTAAGVAQVHGGAGTVEVDRQDPWWSVRMAVPWSKLGSASPRQGSLPVLLGASWRGKGLETAAATLVPLRVLRPPALV